MELYVAPSIGKLLQTKCVVSFGVVLISLTTILGERKRGEYLFKVNIEDSRANPWTLKIML